MVALSSSSATPATAEVGGARDEPSLTKRVVLGVTADVSLTLLEGYPAHLVERGWEVHIVASPGPHLGAFSSLVGVTTHEISMMRQPALGSDLAALAQWILLLARLRPQAVLVGTPKAGLLGSLAAAVTRVPNRVYVLRGLRLETVRGAAGKALLAMERLAAACSHTVFAVSPSLSQRAAALKIGLGKLQVIGRGSSNGIDTSRFDRSRFPLEESARLAARLGLAHGVPVIGFVGRLTIDKGFESLAVAQTLLLADGLDFQLLLVGATEGGVDVLKELQTPGRAPIETGYVDDTAPYYPLMDVLVLPTLREGFPNVVLEASASGVPVVTTDATGAVDSVIDGQTGYITPIQQPLALARALARLLNNPAEARLLGLNGREFVVAEFEQGQFWPRVDNLLERNRRKPFATAGVRRRGKRPATGRG